MKIIFLFTDLVNNSIVCLLASDAWHLASLTLSDLQDSLLCRLLGGSRLRRILFLLGDQTLGLKELLALRTRLGSFFRSRTREWLILFDARHESLPVGRILGDRALLDTSWLGQYALASLSALEVLSPSDLGRLIFVGVGIGIVRVQVRGDADGGGASDQGDVGDEPHFSLF